MRKEVIFAIIAGVTFGLIIAFGVWRANVALRPNGSRTTAPDEVVDEAPSDFGITIAKPQDYQVITTSSTSISGISEPNIWVAVSAEDEDYVTKTDNSGEFEFDVDLIGGVNEIIVTAFGDNGTETQSRLVLVYSSEFDKQEGEEE